MSLWRARVTAVTTFCKSIARKALFLCRWPIAMLQHKIRMRKLQKEVIPLIWLTPAALINRDLDNFVGDKRKFDKAFIDDLAKSRDDMQSKVSKKMLLSFTIFVYLIANFLSISVDIKLPGMEIKYIPGVPEGLLLFISLMSVANMIQLNAIHTLECVMKYAIEKEFPDELKPIYNAKYFPSETYGRYMPINLPQILPAQANYLVSINSAIFFLLIVSSGFIIYASLNIWLIVDLIVNPKIPYVSRSIGIYLAILGIYSFFYFVITRCWMPYNDFSVNFEMDHLSKTDPEKHSKRLAELYDKQIEERERMINAGYIKRRVDPSAI